MSSCTAPGVCEGRRLLPPSDCQCRRWARLPPAIWWWPPVGWGRLVIAHMDLFRCRRRSRPSLGVQMIRWQMESSRVSLPVPRLAKGQMRNFCSVVDGACGLSALPPSSTAFCTGYVNQGRGREGVPQPPNCIPSVWGNAIVKNSATQGLNEGSLASKQQGGVPNPAWKRPQVFELPVLQDSSSFSIGDNSIHLDDGLICLVNTGRERTKVSLLMTWVNSIGGISEKPGGHIDEPFIGDNGVSGVLLHHKQVVSS